MAKITMHIVTTMKEWVPMYWIIHESGCKPISTDFADVLTIIKSGIVSTLSNPKGLLTEEDLRAKRSRLTFGLSFDITVDVE